MRTRAHLSCIPLHHEIRDSIRHALGWAGFSLVLPLFWPGSALAASNKTELQNALNNATSGNTITLTNGFAFDGSIIYTNTPPFTLTLQGEAGKTIVLSGDSGNIGGNANKWLTISPNLTLHLENLTFRDADTTAQTFSGNLEGGGIVSAYDPGSNPVFIGKLAGNTLSGIDVVVSSYIQGGGVVGARSYDGAAAIGDLADNDFSGIEVTSSNYYLSGGGVVGAYSNTGTATIGDLKDNAFTGISIATSTSSFLHGGGVVGAYSNSGATSLGKLSRNIFRGIDVATGTLEGGGMVGVRSYNGTATIGDLTQNIFDDIYTDMGGDTYGGGVVSVYSARYAATLGNLTENTFHDITVRSYRNIYGGGVVSALNEYNYGSAAIGGLKRNIFAGIFTSGGYVCYGGCGVVGAYGSNTGTIGELTENIFTDIDVRLSYQIYGGGVIGAFSSAGAATIGNLAGNIFTDIDVTTSQWGHIYGGGVVGIRSGDGTATMGDLTGNTFTGINIKAMDGDISGGVIGAYANGGSAEIGTLTGNHFTGITLTANNIYGGIVGVFANNASDSASIAAGPGEAISGNEFATNTITSTTASVYGGLLYARSMGDIVNSSFTGNTFSAASRVYGAVTLDTSSTASVGKLTVIAENHGQTIFANNITSDSLGTNRQAESLYLGRLDPGDDSRHSATPAQLDIDARPCSRIDLADPIRVEQDGSFNFAMTVLGSGGEFRWGGINVIDVAAAGSRIDFNSDSRTWLHEGFGVAASSGGVANANVILSPGAELRLPVPVAYDPSTVPYIKANRVEISGLVALDERPVPLIGLAEGDVVLKLEDSGTVLKNDAALGAGRLYRKYDPSYRNYALSWGDGSSTSANNVIVKFLGEPAYDPELGGSDTRTGTNVIAANRPEMELARDHHRSFFSNREKNTPARPLWIDTSYSSSRLSDGHRMGLSYRLETPVILAGADIHATEDAVAGLAVGVSRPKYRGDHTQIEADETLLMAYGAVALENGMELSGEIAAGRARYRHRRKVEEKGCLPCSAPYRDYSDDYRGHDFLAGLELARPVEIGNGWEIRPFVNQDYIRQTVGSYTEKGEGDWALKSERQRNELWITHVGTGIVWQGEEAGRGWRFTGGGQAYWQGRSGDLSADARIAFRDDASGASYQSKSERLPRHSLGLGFHATWKQRDRMNIRLGYDLRAARRETEHEGRIQVEWNW